MKYFILYIKVYIFNIIYYIVIITYIVNIKY